VQPNQFIRADSPLGKRPPRHALLLAGIRGFLAPARRRDLAVPVGGNPHWTQTREQLLTGMLRVGAIFGTLTFISSAMPLLSYGWISILWVQVGLLIMVWALAICRTVNYVLRGTFFVATLYLLGLNEIIHFGYSEDVHAFLTAFSLLALLFFGRRVGAAALGISVLTLAYIGWLLASGDMPAFTNPLRHITTSDILTTSMTFLMVIGTIEVGISVLLNSLHLSWKSEFEARSALQQERDLLEQRVIERTHELAQARDQAIAASRYEAAQKEYLAALHSTTLDLLNHRSVDELFHLIMERAASILDAPYGELMVKEDDTLVVHATTPNQAFLLGQRVTRKSAQISWQAHDTRQPVTLEDYTTSTQRCDLYRDLPLRAVADFPIMIGAECLGVLALGRVEPERTFSHDEIEKGVLFARLAALVLENARLYETALNEIAERKQAEAVLQQFAEELKTQNAELDAFAHTVAHDLKIPLTSVIGYSQLLQISYQQMEPKQIDEFLTIIGSTGRKMTAIINDLLLLSRVRTLESVPIAEIQMGAVVAEVEKRLHTMIADTHARIIKPERWPTSIGYAPWVEEVWANYLSNAVKYGGQPPQVVVGADELSDGQICFWVLDNGPGLSEAQQAKMFAPFTRLHESRAKGHGLGLSIVERIIRKLGGSVGVDSTPGMGCRFYFTLPASCPPEGVDTGPAHNA